MLNGKLELGVYKVVNIVRDLSPTIISLIFGILVLFIIYLVLTNIIRKILKNQIVRKIERENILLIWKVGYAIVAAFLLIFVFTGDLATTGLSVGLLTAALSWALQKPITGIAAWLMVVIKKPFKVGDRVIIGDIRGDVEKIEMFYITVNEVGGSLTTGELISGRKVLIPTSNLFDLKIINYSYGDEYIRTEVSADFTYESNLLKAEEIMKKAAEEATKEYISQVPEKPEVFYNFSSSSVCLKVRYFVKFNELAKTMSDITKKIYLEVIQNNDIEFAYPHTELIYKGKVPVPVLKNTTFGQKENENKEKIN